MDPVEREEKLRTVLVALDHREYLRALSLADQWVTDDPHDPLAYSMRAYTLLNLQRSRDALEDARRAKELAGDDLTILSLFAQAAEAENRLGWAQEAWEEAIARSGGSPQILREYARFMVQHRGPRLALEAAQRAQRSDPSNSMGWSILAAAQLRMHQYEDAENSLRQALALDPNNVQAQSLMAKLLLLKGKQDQALALSQLLEDDAEARPIAEWIRREVKKRDLERILVERALDMSARRPDPGVFVRFRLMWWILAYVGAVGIALVLDALVPGQVFFVLVVVFFLIQVLIWLLMFH
ncbi:MAG: tetratricopeptide repeat protein [Thermogutta sp.]